MPKFNDSIFAISIQGRFFFAVDFALAFRCILLFLLLMIFALATFADSSWNGSRFSQSSSGFKPHAHPSQSVNQYFGAAYSNYKAYADLYATPIAQPNYPIKPRRHPTQLHAYPAQRPAYATYPQRGGLTIIYNYALPTQREYHRQSHSFVHGDANASIQSSSYMLISDWRRYHLPAPHVGMHWIYQNGGYLQMPNDQ